MDNYEVKLLEIADIRVGYQSRARIDKKPGGNFTIIRPADFNSTGKIVPDRIKHFSPPSSINMQKGLITAGDVLFQARGHNHQAYLIEEGLEKTVAANTFYIIRIIEGANILPTYLTWWINQPKLQAYFKKGQGVSTIPFISKVVLAHAPVLIPPLKVQEKISELIQLWQREKGLLQQLICKKEILIQASARKAAAHSKEDK